MLVYTVQVQGARAISLKFRFPDTAKDRPCKPADSRQAVSNFPHRWQKRSLELSWTEEPGRLQSMGSLGIKHD